MHIVYYINSKLKFYKFLSDIIHKHGGCCIFVGGVIRTLIINYLYNIDDDIVDIDIEVYFLNINQIKNILDINNIDYIETGISFGVIKLKKYNVDICIPRKDNCIGKKHIDFQITYLQNSSFKSVSRRRDFRINSIGYILEYRYLLDPNNGIKDIINKNISPITLNTFFEDPLRIFRALYFMSKLDFSIPNKYINLILKHSPSIEFLSKERIGNEFYKILKYNNKYIEIFNILFQIILKVNSNIFSSLINIYNLAYKYILINFIQKLKLIKYKLMIMIAFVEEIHTDDFLYKITNFSKNEIIYIHICGLVIKKIFYIYSTMHYKKHNLLYLIKKCKQISIFNIQQYIQYIFKNLNISSCFFKKINNIIISYNYAKSIIFQYKNSKKNSDLIDLFLVKTDILFLIKYPYITYIYSLILIFST